MRKIILAFLVVVLLESSAKAQFYGSYQSFYTPYGSSWYASSFGTNAFGTRGSFTLSYNNGYPQTFSWYYPYPRRIYPYYPVVYQPVVPVVPVVPIVSVPVIAPLNPIWNPPVYAYGVYPNYVGLRNPYWFR